MLFYVCVTVCSVTWHFFLCKGVQSYSFFLRMKFLLVGIALVKNLWPWIIIVKNNMYTRIKTNSAVLTTVLKKREYLTAR